MSVEANNNTTDSTPEQTQDTPEQAPDQAEALSRPAAQKVQLTDTQGEIDLAQIKNGIEFDQDAINFRNTVGEGMGIKNVGEGLKELTQNSIFLSSLLSLVTHLSMGTFDKKKGKSQEKQNSSPENSELQKKIDAIKNDYQSKLEAATTNKEKKSLTEKMYGKILEEIMKTPVFKNIVDIKIEQAIELHKIDHSDDKDWKPNDSEKQKIIDDTFKDLEKGKDEKEIMKLKIEKIKYLCGDSKYSEKEIDFTDLASKVNEEFPEYLGENNVLNKNILNENNLDTIKEEIQKTKDFFNILIETGFFSLFFKENDLNINDALQKSYYDEIFKFEEELCDSLGKLTNPTESDKKNCIKTCYQTLKTNILNLNRESNDKDTIEGIMQDYIKKKGGVFEEIVNEDNAPSEATE